MGDKLHWWEEIPLGLATLAQSVVVGLWYYKSIHLGDDWLNIAVAVVAGLALDLIVVTTVMGRRQGRESAWSNGSAFAAFLCSALIAVDTYSSWLGDVRPLLHISYPLMVLLYSQHLAGVRKKAPQEDVQAVITIDHMRPTSPQVATQPLAPQLQDTQAKASNRQASPLAGVDVPTVLRERFGNDRKAMASHYGVSRQAIDSRLRGMQ